MKQAPLILSVLAFLGVIALAVVVLKPINGGAGLKPAARAASGEAMHKSDIAYFELDTLENQYQYSIEMRNYLRKKDDEYNRRMQSMRNNYAREVQEANQRGPSMTQSEQMQVNQKLAMMDNEFRREQAVGGQRLESETIQKVQEVKQRIQSFLNQYAAEKGYRFVLASSQNDFIYFKDSAQNITTELIEALNKEYKATKKPKQ